MEQHLGDAKHDTAGKNSGNSRNDKSRKTVRSIHGDIEFEDFAEPQQQLRIATAEKVKNSLRQVTKT